MSDENTNVILPEGAFPVEVAGAAGFSGGTNPPVLVTQATLPNPENPEGPFHRGVQVDTRRYRKNLSRSNPVTPTEEGSEDELDPTKPKKTRGKGKAKAPNEGSSLDMDALRTILQGVAAVQSRSFAEALQEVSVQSHSRNEEEKAREPKHQSVGLLLKEARYRKLQFGGTTQESVMMFIRQVNELLEVAKLSAAEVKRVIPDLLIGGAAQWYRVHKDDFRTWKEVAAALKRNYLTPDHDTQLAVLLHTRHQDPNEKVIHYITQMRSINSDMEVPLAADALIPLIRSHVHPKIARAIVFQATPDFVTLEQVALQAEHLVAQESNYAPPSFEVVSHPVYGDTDAVAARKRKPAVHAIAPEPEAAEKKAVSQAGAEAAPVRVMHIQKRPQQGTPAQTRMPRPGASAQEADHQCKGCGITGHMENVCPTTPRPFCFLCGAKNTVIRECCKRPTGNA